MDAHQWLPERGWDQSIRRVLHIRTPTPLSGGDRSNNPEALEPVWDREAQPATSKGLRLANQRLTIKIYGRRRLRLATARGLALALVANQRSHSGARFQR